LKIPPATAKKFHSAIIFYRAARFRGGLVAMGKQCACGATQGWREDRVAGGDYMPSPIAFALGGVNDDGVVSDDCGAEYCCGIIGVSVFLFFRRCQCSLAAGLVLGRGGSCRR